MEDGSNVTAIAHVIQLAVAPVFLIAGVGGLLNVLTNRLGRIIDRARITEEKLGVKSENSRLAEQCRERLLVFSARARWVNYAITLCTASASMICLVVIALFGAAFFEIDLAELIGLLFTLSMVALFSALLCFLREIQLSTRSLRIGATTDQIVDDK
jgi:hypothetical protein